MDLSRLTNFNRVEKLSFPALVKENLAFYLLGLNLLLALFLRLYNLAGIPVWVTPDEAVNGVDAYSLSQTLRDHHGNFDRTICLAFRAFGIHGKAAGSPDRRRFGRANLFTGKEVN
jgi:hypothetical protein